MPLLAKAPRRLLPPSDLLCRRRHLRADFQVLRYGRRSLYLAPPFLLDEPYLPRYMTLSPTDAARKRSSAYAHLRNCNLCPRLCGVNRYERTGYCMIPASTVKVSTIAPHFGEEPCIQGTHGSGAVFFNGCNLRCVFCQNWDIAHTVGPVIGEGSESAAIGHQATSQGDNVTRGGGFDLTPEELGEWYVKLQNVGEVHNINLVTPEHVVPQVALSIMHAQDLGLTVPIVYNTSAFDSLESLELLDGLVDIYMPDFKVWNPERSKRLLKADDYATAARESLKAMYKQVGDLCFTANGLAKKGVLLRHLVMPGMEEDGQQILQWVAKEVSGDCYVSVMEQYHPDAYVGRPTRVNKVGQVRYEEINRPIGESEVTSVRKAAEHAGLWRFCEPARHEGFNL